MWANKTLERKSSSRQGMEASLMNNRTQNYPILVLSREPGQSPAITHKEKCKTLRATLYQESPSLPIPIEANLLCRQDNKIPFEEVTYTEVQKALSLSSSNTAASTS